MSAPADLRASASETGAPAVEAAAPPAPRRGRLFVKYVVSLVGLVAVLLIGNGALDVWFSYKEAKQTLVRIQQEKAESAAQRIAEFVDEIQRQIGWTTHAQWSAGSVDQRRFDYVRLLRQVPAITELAQLDSDGYEQLKVSRLAMDVVGSGTDYSQDPKFTQAVAHKLWFSPVYFRKESEPYMTIAIAHAGRKPGVTVADVNLKLIWDVVSAIKVGEAGYAYVVGPDGRLIAHPDISLVLRNTDLSGLPQVAAALASPAAARDPADNVTIAPNYAGLSVLTAHAAIPALDWLVFVELPASEALAPLYELLTRSGILLGLGLLLAAAAGGWLARRMVVPIGELERGAERLGAGELDHRIELKTGDEIEALADRFNVMGAQLKESYATLEAKVEARTHELAEALEYQTATSEVLRIVASSPDDLQPVFDAMLKKATELCEAEYGLLLLYDGEAYKTVAVRNLPAAVAAVFGTGPLRLGPNTGAGRAIQTKRPIALEDMRKDIAYIEREPHRVALVEVGGARAQLAVPLLKKGEPIGVFIIYLTEPGAFAENQIALVRTFADQAVIAIENARLISETREALEQQTATAEVLQVINASPGDLAPVFEAMLENATRICRAEFGRLVLYDGELFTTAAIRGATAEYTRFMEGYKNAPDRSVALDRMVRELKPVHLPDITLSPRYLAKDPFVVASVELGGARSLIAVPLLKGQTLIGGLVLFRQRVEAFTEKEMALVATFADQAVIAIENARLLGELRSRNTDLAESLEQQTVTGEVLKVISRSTFDLTPVFETLAENAVKLCAAERAIIFRFDGKVLRPAAWHNASAELMEYVERNPIAPGRHSVSARAALQRRTVQIADVQADPEYSYALSDIDPIRTLLAVPMLKGDDLVGVITIYRLEVKPFTDKQIALVTIFADQAVIAIENARLLGELRDRSAELARSVDELTATSDVLKIISRSSVELKTVLDTLVETAARLCHADQAHMFRRHPDGLHHLTAAWGIAEDAKAYVQTHPFAPDRGTTSGRAALERRPVQIPDVLADPEYTYTEGARVVGFRTMLGVPLLREDTLIGVFVIGRNRVAPFTQKEIELLTTFADQAVIAIENARLFEELRERSAELARSVDELTATSDVLKIISRSTVELKTVLDTLVETAASLCHADQALMFRRQGDHYQMVASRGTSRELEEWLSCNPFAAGPGTATGRAGAAGRTVHIPDVLADPEYTFAEEGKRLTGARTLVSVPLVRGEVLIGVFTLWRTRVAPFTGKEIELVTTFADQAVIAIENARLFEELRDRSAELARSVEELTTLREVGQAVSSTLDLATVLETIVRRAVALAGAEAGAIYRYRKSDRQFRLGTSYGLGEELTARIRGARIRAEETTSLARAIEERAPAQIPDLVAAPHLPLRDLMVAAGFRAALQVPLVGADRVFGVLSIQKKTVGEFPESTVKLMQTFASQSVLAIQNARLFREVEEQGRALALASQHKSQFLANMSHELRTPLNAVLGYAELLADGIYGELGEKARGVLERIQSNGKHLLGLINDVLDLSKIEAGQLTLAIDDYAMPAVVHSVVSAAESLAKAKGLALVTSVPRVLPMGRGDERRLTQVLLNLVGNAIKFTEKGSVGIEVTLADNCFEIAVKDTGPGIAEADQARIFEEFQQVDNSSTRQKGGTGLGLAISKRIVEMHGGAITVASEPGKGSTFLVVVPVRVEPAKEVA